MTADPKSLAGREGSLEAPTRHPVPWQEASFNDPQALAAEMERVFDICHGCRRCFSLCHAFPHLFDAIDSGASGELDGVPQQVRWEVVDHCYLCDMCYMTKCPYVPPHPWNVDFPHLMLRAKAVRFRQQGAPPRERLLAATDVVGRIAGIPVVAQAVNAAARTATGRRLLETMLGVHRQAPVPRYHVRTGRRRVAHGTNPAAPAEAAGGTRGRVALFTTCYCNRNEPDIAEDLAVVFRHNGIAVRTVPRERCCGMPRLELGDLEAIDAARRFNVPRLAALVDEGWDLVAPVPSCVLIFKQELPLLFPDDAEVAKVRAAMFDPFDYLMRRHRAGLLRTDFSQPLGKVSYHVPCHLRVQNIGLKTRDVLALVPGTEIDTIERCSGHDGTYGVKKAYRDFSMKIGRPVFNRVAAGAADHYSSDCPLAGRQIESGLDGERPPTHPLTLLRRAYGI
jgi:Fe-S oxidoreductase